MTADKPSNLVPKLRFPEFRDMPEWEPRQLSEVLDYEQPGKYIVEDTDYQDTGTPVLTANKGFVLGHTADTDGIYDNVPAIIFDDFTTDTKYVDFAFKVKSSAIKILTSRRDDELKLLFELMSRIRFDSTQHKRYYISQYQHLEIALPNRAEQQKVADCLGSLDDLIAAEGRKLDALRQHKQGLMQQLFPQPGETVPRLRFPEFEDAGPWEQLTIDEAADLKNGYAFKSDTYIESGDFQIVTIGNVQEGRLDLESTKSIATLPRDIQNHQILKPADILVSMTGNVGRVCLVPVDGLLLNQRVGKLIPCRIDHDFFFQMLNRDKFRSAMQLAAAGGAQGNVSAGEIKSFVFARPVDPREQRGIADCLSTLDTQIAAQVRKLDALRQHKQGLTQQLFPSLEAESR